MTKGTVEAILLARGGSKGIPGKNIRKLCGKPLIGYGIEAAKEAGVDEVWVSTDCSRIKSVSLNLGASVIDRPGELARDNSPSEEALMHFIQERPNIEVLVFIQPTSPLVRGKDIAKGIQEVSENGYDSVFSGYTKDWEAEFTEEMQPLNWDFEHRPRRQDIGPIYVENGAFYVTTAKQLKKTGRRYGGKIGFVPMSRICSLQIDQFADLVIAERIIQDDSLRRY